jgi:hypothetical protein
MIIIKTYKTIWCCDELISMVVEFSGIAIRFQANQDQLGIIEEVFKSIN